MDVTSDEELLARARTDGAAFGVFYRRHAPAVLSFLVRRSGSAQDGAELTAETFAAALEHVGSYRADRAPAVTWLFAIARNQLIDYHRSGVVRSRARRRVGIRPIAMDDEALERVERLASLEVSAEVLHEALDELPAPQREAVIARVVGELTYEEIGARDDSTTAAVRQRVSRGLAALRHRLGDGS